MSAVRANGHAAGAAASENRSSVMAQMTAFEQLFGGGVSASQVIIRPVYTLLESRLTSS